MYDADMTFSPRLPYLTEYVRRYGIMAWNLWSMKLTKSPKPIFKAQVLEALWCEWNTVAFSSFEALSLLPVFQAPVSGPLKPVISLQLLENNPHA